MIYTDIYVNENFGNHKIKVRIVSREPLTDYQKEYLSTLKRDEVITYGKIRKWTVLDIQEWE